MRVILEQINCHLLTLSRVKFIIISLFISISTRFLFNNIVLLALSQDAGLENPFMDKQNIFAKLFMSLLLAPIIETFIFFLLPFRAAEFLKTKWVSVPLGPSFIIISSLLFACNHGFSSVYFLTSLFGGSIMAVFYLLSIRRNENAYQNTVVLHCLYNLFVVSSKYL